MSWLNQFADPADQENAVARRATNHPAPITVEDVKKTAAAIGSQTVDAAREAALATWRTVKATGEGIAAGGVGVGRAVQMAGAVPAIAIDAATGKDAGAEGSLTADYFDATEPTMRSAQDAYQADEDAGTVGQIGYGLGRIVLPLMLGARNPAAINPTALIGSETALGSVDAVDAGATGAQAAGIGIAQGAAVGLGFKLPAAIGKTVVAKVASGAAINVGVGMGLRTAQNAIAGDNEQLSQKYDPTDPTALVTDATLGAAFGGIAAFAARRRALPIEQQDAAAAADAETHLNDLADGEPVTPRDAQNHRNNVDEAVNAILEGRDPNLAPVNTTPRPEPVPATPAAHPTLTGHAATIAQAAEATGVDPTTAVIISHIETGGRFNADAQNPTSSANGLFQVINSSWTRLGGGDRSSVSEQIRVGLLHMQEVSKTLRAKLGREPATHEQYMGHLLGSGGAGVVLRADPNARLYDVVLGYTKGKTKAERVKIAQDTVNNNGMRGLTVGEAIAKWKAKTDTVAAKYGKAGDARPVDGTPVVDTAPPEVTTIQDPSMVFLDELFGGGTHPEPAAHPAPAEPPPSEVDQWFYDMQDAPITRDQQTANDITTGFNAIAAAAESASRSEVGRSITDGKADRLTMRKPDAIAAAEANPNYNVQRNADGSATIIGVKTDESGWIGVERTAPTDASLTAPRAAVDLAAQAIDQGRPVALRDPAVIRSAETLPEYNLRRNADGTAEIIGARQSDGTWSGTPKPDAPAPNTRTSQPQPTPDAQPATGADSAGSTPDMALPAQDRFLSTLEQSNAAQVLAAQDIMIPTGALDAEGNPVLVSGRELLDQMRAERTEVYEQTTATDAAISCFLGAG
jgi:hypothetical protein